MPQHIAAKPYAESCLMKPCCCRDVPIPTLGYTAHCRISQSNRPRPSRPNRRLSTRLCRLPRHAIRSSGRYLPCLYFQTAGATRNLRRPIAICLLGKTLHSDKTQVVRQAIYRYRQPLHFENRHHGQYHGATKSGCPNGAHPSRSNSAQYLFAPLAPFPYQTKDCGCAFVSIPTNLALHPSR